MTILQYGNCVHIYFNSVHLSYVGNANRCTLYNFLTSTKTIACLSIFIELYLWHSVGMMACDASISACLFMLYFHDVTLNSVILREIII